MLLQTKFGPVEIYHLEQDVLDEGWYVLKPGHDWSWDSYGPFPWASYAVKWANRSPRWLKAYCD